MADQTIERMVVDGPPERCFEVVADIERYPEWVADLKEVHVHERDEQGRPMLVSFRAGAFGRSTSYTLVYDYSRAPTELRWVQRDGDLTSRLDGIYRFAPRPRGWDGGHLPARRRTAGPAAGLHQAKGRGQHHPRRHP